MNIKTIYYKSPFGELILGEYNNRLCLCDWTDRRNRKQIDRRLKKEFQADFVEESTALLEKAQLQLQEYFNTQRVKFDIPLIRAGTEFQQKVWATLIQIPYGQTISYKELSQNIGKESAFRAVANANGANAISIFIPCHRVIASDGSLGGYAGGLEAKKSLLTLEMK